MEELFSFRSEKQAAGNGMCWFCWLPQKVCSNKQEAGKRVCRVGELGPRISHTAWFNPDAQWYGPLHAQFKTEEEFAGWMAGWDVNKVANPWRLLLWVLKRTPEDTGVLRRLD